ncbi:MAG: TetR/AcrR family transcriptional regulator [Saprospiraceae bacterium]|nr:TetR/AcrR family transcriptional regulator [Saprospiraceae bacterium]
MKSKIKNQKNTKSLIVDTALKLFNKMGLSKVTLRTIAKDMGISQGNLNYHFKKRKDIIETLYFQLVCKMEQNFHSHSDEALTIKNFFNRMQEIMKQFYAYRFFMLDFVQIMRENKVISSHYQQLTVLRQKQVMGIFKGMIDKGIMRNEEIKDEYLNLYIRMNIMGDFWLSSAITTQDLSPKLIDKYIHIIFQEFYPYLTPKGKEQFSSITS